MNKNGTRWGGVAAVAALVFPGHRDPFGHCSLNKVFQLDHIHHCKLICTVYNYYWKDTPPTISHRQMNIVGSSFLYYKKFTDTITRPLYGHELFPSCLCWSVNGTYWANDKLASLIELCKIKTSLEFERTLTPMTFCELTFPASSLSTCSINCIKVPTGINMRPGFASCSIKAGGSVGAAAPTWIAS